MIDQTMLLISILWTCITGFSVGYIAVYYRRVEYEKYYGLLFYVLLGLLAWYMGLPLLTIVLGGISCFIALISIYDPLLGGKYKIHDEPDFGVFKNK